MPGELVYRKLLELHQGNGDRITDGKGSCGTGGWRQIQHTCLAGNLQIHTDVAHSSNSGAGHSGERNQGNVDRLQNRQQPDQFRAFPTFS